MKTKINILEVEHNGQKFENVISVDNTSDGHVFIRMLDKTRFVIATEHIHLKKYDRFRVVWEDVV